MVKIKKTAVVDTPLISQATIKNSRGFTLIELMIVVAIIAAVAAISLPRINNKNNELRSTLRKFTVLARDLRSRAKLQNATYRIVIDLGDEDKKSSQSYWVEKAAGEIASNYDPKNPPKPPTAKSSTSEKDDDEDSEKSNSQFSADPSVFKKPQVLIDELRFTSVELGLVDEPITSGIVYIHFKPSGYADEAALHLKSGEKANWTIYFHPLTGRAEIVDEDQPLENLRPK